MKAKRTRTMTIKCDYVTVIRSWNKSALILEDVSEGRPVRRVTVLITHPGDIQYLKERLQMIKDGWRKQLGELT